MVPNVEKLRHAEEADQDLIRTDVYICSAMPTPEAAANPFCGLDSFPAPPSPLPWTARGAQQRAAAAVKFGGRPEPFLSFLYLPLHTPL